MASAKKRIIQDKSGTQFFPITHTEAVIDNNGDTVEVRLGRKQDTLVSGTSIKTINNNSLLGSGNITISSGGQVTVDSALSSTSTNPVQNKVITSALNDKQDTISDLATIRSGAALGATALQSYTETDPTVPAWAKASSKPSYTASEVGAIASSLKGAANGIAELDSSGLVPSSQLPSYVDDVLEYNSKSAFPSTGETGKIYVDKATNLTYRWGGSAYVEISPSLALGTTSSTAFRGDYGNTAYTHATNKGSAFTSGLYKITTNSEGHVTAATAVEKADITALGIPSANTTYTNGTGLSLSGTTFSLAASGVTAGTYYKTTVDTYGRVTGGSYANLSAAINGDLTEGTSDPQDADYYIAQYAGGGTSTTTYHRRPHSALYNYINSKLAAAHAGLDKVGTITSVTKGTATSGGAVSTSGGAVTVQFPTIPTSLPASDVSAWAKAASKPSYALSEITGADDVKAIEALTGTSGLLKKTAANTWGLDTSTYLTASTLPARYIGNAAIQSSAQTAQNLGGIGNFTAAGTVSASDASFQALELKPSSASAGNGGYIDFHYNNSSSDYTTRIIENASGTIQIVGNAQVTGSLTSGGNQVEVQSNKVTSLSSSSTDTQYPSAKCVYDLIGDIETLINSL